MAGIPNRVHNMAFYLCCSGAVVAPSKRNYLYSSSKYFMVTSYGKHISHFLDSQMAVEGNGVDIV